MMRSIRKLSLHRPILRGETARGPASAPTPPNFGRFKLPDLVIFRGAERLSISLFLSSAWLVCWVLGERSKTPPDFLQFHLPRPSPPPRAVTCSGWQPLCRDRRVPRVLPRPIHRRQGGADAPGPKPRQSKETKPTVARKSPKDDGARVRDLETRLAAALKG